MMHDLEHHAEKGRRATYEREHHIVLYLNKFRDSVPSVTKDFVQNCDQVQYLIRVGLSKSLLRVKCVDTK